MSRPQVFRKKSQRSPPPVSQTSLALRVKPHAAKHSAEKPSTSGDPHELTRSTLAPQTTLLHFTCARDATHSSAACAWSSSRRSRSCRQSTETIGRYRRPTASAMPRAQTTRVRSGSIACVTAVHRGAYWRRRSRSERSESHLRSWDRRTGDQDHRGRCPADQSRPWGRIRGARGALK